MILFLTLKNPQIFLEFSYLGFVFGMVWFVLKTIINRVDHPSKKIKQKEIKENQKKFFKMFMKTITIFKKSILTILKVLIFLGLIFGVWLINFKLNYGYLRIPFVLVFLLFCGLGVLFCKTVANLFINFYNKHKEIKNGR